MNPEATIGQLVVERPSRTRVFEKFGIDYCCGGNKPLHSVCQDKGIDLIQVVYALGAADQSPAPTGQDWNTAPFTSLADHIEQTHHAYLKAELPRLHGIISKVAKAHGAKHPEVITVLDVFAGFKAELEHHMAKEEQVLFPLCRTLDGSATHPHPHCGSIGNPIAVMVREHNDAGEAMARMRELLHDYEPPAGACNTYRAMLSGLAELEADMHQHVHKENNILFPRSMERERQT